MTPTDADRAEASEMVNAYAPWLAEGEALRDAIATLYAERRAAGEEREKAPVTTTLTRDDIAAVEAGDVTPERLRGLVAAWRNLRYSEDVNRKLDGALRDVSGALADTGDIPVPFDQRGYGEAVRQLTTERDAARNLDWDALVAALAPQQEVNVNKLTSKGAR